MIRPTLRHLAAASLLVVGMAACTGGQGVQPTPQSTTADPTSAALASETAPAPTSVASPSIGPAATVFIPASDDFLADVRYTCGGADFPLAILDGPGGAEDSEDLPAAVLRGELQLFGTATWWLAHRTPDEAEYIGLNEFGTYWYLLAETSDGGWRARGYGDCQMRASVPNSTVVTWWIPAARWPEPGDDALDITVRDECPDTVEDRMLEPIIRYGPEAIVIILPTEPVGEPHPHCGDGTDQLRRVTFELDQPVGDRGLFDGASWPVRDAHTKTDPLVYCCG